MVTVTVDVKIKSATVELTVTVTVTVTVTDDLFQQHITKENAAIQAKVSSRRLQLCCGIGEWSCQ